MPKIQISLANSKDLILPKENGIKGIALQKMLLEKISEDGAQSSYLFFMWNFYFILGHSWFKMLWRLQVDSKGTQPYIYMDPFCPKLLSIQAATRHWAEFPVMSSRSLLVLRVKYSRVSMSIPDSLTIPSPILPPGDHKVITEYWAEFPVLDSRSLLVLRVKYSHVHSKLPDYPFPTSLPP